MPAITKAPIGHRLYRDAGSIFTRMVLDAPDGKVILLLGPTQSGKSLLYQQVVASLRQSFIPQCDGALPVIDLQIETVGDGRAKPKWLGLELLKVLRHPVYEHLGRLDELEHYFPSRGRDEGSIRIALKEALAQRQTRRVCLDELHLLTRAKDEELRAAILESIKSTCAINRTLIGCGGYELAYKGLFDSAHFCGRVVVYDFGNYEAGNPLDLIDWKKISKTLGERLPLEPKTLLVDKAKFTLEASNGVYGLFEKWLWHCKMVATARGTPITFEILKACAPPKRERDVIARDIKLGKAALANMSVINAKPTEDATDSTEVSSKNESKPPRAPFERRPNRNAAQKVALHDDD